MTNKPVIGVLDSDIGGLSVVNEIKKYKIPFDIVYYADTKNYPYGTKSTKEVIEFVKEALEFFSQKKAYKVLCACSTASAVAVPELKKHYSFELLGMFTPLLVEYIEKLVPKDKIVGLIATELTVKSRVFESLFSCENKKRIFSSFAASDLVDAITDGDLSSEVISPLIKKYLNMFDMKALGGVIVGCTHFYHVKDQIADILGNNIPLIEPSSIVVKYLMQGILNDENTSSETPGVFSYVTGEKDIFRERVKVLEKIKKTSLVDEYIC